MRAVILNFTGARENWGCQATSVGLYRFLSHVLEPHGFSEINTVPLPPSHFQDVWHRKKYGVQIRDTFSSQTPNPDQLKLIERLCRSRFKSHVDTVKNADLIFFQGEGTMGPSKFYECARVFALPYLAKKLWKKPVISLNQSFVVSIAADIPVAENVFNSFNLNAFREEKSWRVATENGIKNSVLCPDFAFVDAYDKVSERPKDLPEEYFCVTGSAALSEYDIGNYAETVEAIHLQTGLFPVCLYSRKSDKKFVQAIIERLGESRAKIISQSNFNNVYQILPVLKQAAFTLGGRYHTAISSLCMRTPVILTAGNSYKSEGLGDMLGLHLPIMSPDDATAIVKQAKIYLENEDRGTKALKIGLQNILKTHVAFSKNLSGVIPEILADRPVSASELVHSVGSENDKGSLNLPVLSSQIPVGGEYSRLRTQLDLVANLSQYEWNAKAE